MNKFYKNLSLIFAAGCLGGLAKGICAWMFGLIGLSSLLGSQYAPPLTPSFIYSHIVWGGIWGLLFFLPIKGWSYYSLGVIYSIPQSLVALLVMFPNMNRGLLGLNLGRFTPVMVLFYGLVWGIVMAWWLKASKES